MTIPPPQSERCRKACLVKRPFVWIASQHCSPMNQVQPPFHSNDIMAHPLHGRGRDEDFSSPPHRSARARLTHRAPPRVRRRATNDLVSSRPTRSHHSDRRGISAQCSNRGRLTAVPLGWGPSLHDFRRELPNTPILEHFDPRRLHRRRRIRARELRRQRKKHNVYPRESRQCRLEPSRRKICSTMSRPMHDPRHAPLNLHIRIGQHG
jgi:hypothetical protein